MEQPVYHVVLEGRKIGPYDRRTIVGMRIKEALQGDHVLIGPGSSQLTVADLIGQVPLPPEPFNPNRSDGFSVVQATFLASLVEATSRAGIPRFKGEIEARVQGQVLRLAGRFRHGLGWKEDRAKLSLRDVAHARVTGSQVELWLRSESSKRMPRIALELFTPEAAGELVDWLPGATPLPQAGGTAASSGSGQPGRYGIWVALGGVSMVVLLMLGVLLLRRVY